MVKNIDEKSQWKASKTKFFYNNENKFWESLEMKNTN